MRYDRTFRMAICAIAMLVAIPATSMAEVKEVPMYMLGYAASFKDSVAYITPVHLLDTVTIDKKTKFLQDRHLYSLQLQQYIAETFGSENALTAVLYDTKKSRLDKKALEIRNRIQKDNSLRIKDADYRFHTEKWIEPEIVSTDEEAEETTEQKKSKGKKKRNRK